MNKEQRQLKRLTEGRQKGVPNKITGELRRKIADIIEDYIEGGGKTGHSMKEDFDSLPPIGRLQMTEKLMQYVIPKMQSVAFNDDEGVVKSLLQRRIEEDSVEK